MAPSSSAPQSSPTAVDPKNDLRKQMRSHEVAIAELNNLSSSRGTGRPSCVCLYKEAVYQRNGNLYFRTSIKAATASEQRQLDLAKSQLQKLNSA